MSAQSLYRWAGYAAITAAIVLTIGAVTVAMLPVTHTLPPLAYFAGLLVAVPGLIGSYTRQAQHAGRLGFVGLVLAMFGAMLYCIPIYSLIAGTSGITSWHDMWGYAMGNVLPFGASAFLLGTLILGIATFRAAVLPRWSGVLLAAGAFLWLIAFWFSAALLLTIGTVMISISFAWIGSVLVARNRATQVEPGLHTAAA